MRITSRLKQFWAKLYILCDEHTVSSLRIYQDPVTALVLAEICRFPVEFHLLLRNRCFFGCCQKKQVRPHKHKRQEVHHNRGLMLETLCPSQDTHTCVIRNTFSHRVRLCTSKRRLRAPTPGKLSDFLLRSNCQGL